MLRGWRLGQGRHEHRHLPGGSASRSGDADRYWRYPRTSCGSSACLTAPSSWRRRCLMLFVAGLRVLVTERLHFIQLEPLATLAALLASFSFRRLRRLRGLRLQRERALPCPSVIWDQLLLMLWLWRCCCSGAIQVAGEYLLLLVVCFTLLIVASQPSS